MSFDDRWMRLVMKAGGGLFKEKAGETTVLHDQWDKHILVVSL